MATIKSALMAALETTLGTIPELKRVTRVKAWPVELDTTPLPALFFFDEGEDITWIPERAQATLSLVTWVFANLTPKGPVSFNDVADLMQARVHDALVSMIRPEAAGAYFLKMDSESVRKDLPNDVLGVLVMTHHLTYAHVWGNSSLRP